MATRAPFSVAQVGLLVSHVLETKGTDVELGSLSEKVGVWRVVPAINLEPAKLNSVDVFHLLIKCFVRVNLIEWAPLLSLDRTLESAPSQTRTYFCNSLVFLLEGGSGGVHVGYGL